MSSVTKSVDVAVPIRTAYDQWTQFEEFPQFMEGVEEVRQISDTMTHWKVDIGGRSREFDARITEQIPDERVAWTSTGGIRQAGVVTFHRLDEHHTRVTAQLDFEPQGLLDGVIHEALDLGLAPVAQGVGSEAARKALHAREADLRHFHRVSGQQRDARLGEDLRHLIGLAGFVVVVAQHAEHRHAYHAELLGEHMGLFRRSIVGQIPAQEQDVGRLVNLAEPRGKLPQRGLRAVKVPHGCETDRLFLLGCHAFCPLSRAPILEGQGTCPEAWLLLLV